ncbi:uncharacterized protein An15g03900 [Aspergillus niger]|uniref:Contig An15c0140, genomic contig n=2 Tax=Aspergillus niger TaxID=5061 RepID=A5ABY7_ASPNC|nr:uncharacterized protein An15g03900 [Aspergillus niger]CAK97259.1 unnamed protein product [Aspergillus niger]
MGLSKTNRILILLAIDTAFFLLELIAGYSVHSLALVADSFHMLNDVLSLCVGLWAVKVANRETNSKMYTYGWQRAETLGALVNGVFLVALCLSIFLEAIQRLVEPQEVKNPKFVCIVGCLGLLSNIIGLVLFHDHSHGHGHSHGPGDLEEGADVDHVHAGEHDHDHDHVHADGQNNVSGPVSIKSMKLTTSDEDLHKFHNHAQPKPKDEKHGHGHGHDLNMRGVFLHVMGDALGNIGVIASALIIWLTDYSWRFYVDPGISLVITVIILLSAIPLCKAASRILLQAAPHGLSIDHIKEDIEGLPGVIGSHHLHVWQLSDTKLVASIHIQVDTEIKGEGSERYMRLARQVRKCLHAYGIHSSTIQPEFAPDSDTEDTIAAPSDCRGGSNGASASGTLPSRAPSVPDGDPQACLLECGEECARGGQCCPKQSP